MSQNDSAIKQNILIVTRDLSYPGGTETFMINYIEYLLIMGYKVCLLETDSHRKFSNVKFYSRLKKLGLKVIRVPEENQNKFELTIAAELIVKTVKKYQISIVHSFLFNADFAVYLAKLGTEKAISKIASDKDSKKLISILDKNIFPYKKIIEGKTFFWVSSKFSEFSVAMEENNKEWKKRKKVIDENYEKLISKETDVIVCASTSISKKWKKWNKRVEIIPCSSISSEEMKKYAFLAKNLKRNNSQQSLQLITVSRLVAGKGLEQLIKSFLKYIKSNPNSQLTIVGDGPEEQSLKALSKGCERVIFTGFLSRNEVLEEIIKNDFFCLFSESEGLPLSIQESLALGKPVLATNVGGVSDLVINNQNGFLINNGNVKEIERLFHKIHSIKMDKLKELGRNAKKVIKEKFLTEIAFRRNERLYKGGNLR